MVAAEHVTYAPEDPSRFSDQNVANVKAALDDISTQVEDNHPDTTTDDAIARYDGTTGQLQNSEVTLSDGRAFTADDLTLTANTAGDITLNVSGGGTINLSGPVDLAGDNITDVGDLELDSLTKDGAGDIAINDNLDFNNTQDIVDLDLLNGRKASNFAREMNFLRKAADESITFDNTLSSDGDLQFSATANRKYRIQGLIIYDSHINADFQVGFTAPALATWDICYVAHRADGANQAPRDTMRLDETNNPSRGYATGNLDEQLRFSGVLVMDANAGTFAFQWAQNVNNAQTTTVYANSWMEAIEI